MFILLFQRYMYTHNYLANEVLSIKSLDDLHEFIDKDPYNINYCYVNRCFSGASNHLFTL